MRLNLKLFGREGKAAPVQHPDADTSAGKAPPPPHSVAPVQASTENTHQVSEAEPPTALVDDEETAETQSIDLDEKQPIATDVTEDGPSSADEVDSGRNKEIQVAEASTSATHGEPEQATKEGADGDDEAEDEDDDDDSKFPTALPLALLTFGLCVTTFVVALDNTIIATAIPKITTVFNSLNDVGWYGSSYLLTTTSLQPSFGKIYTYFNIKWTYITAIVIFELGSVLCATATSSTMLIVGRAVAGAGASALFSGGMTIIGFSVPLRKRAIYIAMLSSMFGISSVVGPLLGGAFTDRLTWRWCFWINLPFGGIAISTVVIFFKNPERKQTNLSVRQKIGEIDLFGAFFLICGIVCLLLALQWGGSVYPWKDSRVYGCLIGFGLIISVFIVLQHRKGDRATIPPRILLHQRTVLVCAVFSCFVAMGVYSHIFYLPFYFQAVKGTTAEGSGIRTIPYLVSITLASIAVGGAITVLGPYAPFMWFGSAVFAIGAGLLITLKVASTAGLWIGYQILAAIGVGSCIQIPFIAIQVVLNKKDMPSGNAIAIFFNSLGGAIAISIAQNIFSNSLIKEIPKHTTGVDPAVIIAAGATHIREVTPVGQLAGVLKAYNIAVTRALILPIATGTAAFVVSIFVEWRSVKGKKLMAGGAA